MRVLFLSNLFPRPYARGWGIFCYHFCAAIAKEHALRVISPRTWVERMRQGPLAEQTQGLRWDLPAMETVAPLTVSYPTFYYPPKTLQANYGSFMWTSLRRQLLPTAKQFAPDVVISFWVHPDGEVGVRLARALNVPAITCAIGSDVLVVARHAKRRRSATRALNESSAVVAVSQDLKDKIVGMGVPGAKVHVIHTGLHQELFRPGDQQAARRHLNLPETGKIALFVGNLVPVKGVDVLLRAVARLDDPALQLYVVGAGSLRGALLQLCRTLKIAERVHFVGAVPQTELPNWYRAADVMVMASHSEGIPNVLREAQACHTPIVATRVGGIPEVAVPGMSRLVPANDPVAMAEALLATLAQDRDALPPVPRFDSWEVSGRQLMDLAKQQVASHGLPDTAIK